MDWGADSATLLKLYRSHVRSKLDYGCVVYGSARPWLLQTLDRVQNAALRTCLGAFQTSPISSLRVEAGEMPLKLRREKLALQYMLKLKSNPDNPAHSCVFSTDFKTHFGSRPHIIPTFGIRLQDQLYDVGVDINCVAKYHVPDTPPWLLRDAQFDYTLHDIGCKSDTPPEVFRARFNEVIAVYGGFSRMYTDGSKEDAAVAAAAVTESAVLVKRLPDHSSIFSVEARAILLTLDAAMQSANDRFVVLSDSLSCLQAIQNRKLNNALILDIVCRVHQLVTGGSKVVFMWLPSHVGIGDNSVVDAAAKAALNLTVGAGPVPFTDFQAQVGSYVRRKWQTEWDGGVRNKLHAIQPIIPAATSYRLPRRDELIVHRLRLGHTHATHSYLLKGENPPQCSGCSAPLTVEHLLVSCSVVKKTRLQFFNESSLLSVFSNVAPRKIVDFIKAVGFYRKV
jgi:ribonuclease HI